MIQAEETEVQKGKVTTVPRPSWAWVFALPHLSYHPPLLQPKPFFHINPRSLVHFKATSDLFNSLAGCVLLTFYNLDLSLCPWLSSRSLQGQICCPCASLGQWKTKQCTWQFYSQFFVYSFNMVTGSWMCFFVVLGFFLGFFVLFIFLREKKETSLLVRERSPTMWQS